LQSQTHELHLQPPWALFNATLVGESYIHLAYCLARWDKQPCMRHCDDHMNGEAHLSEDWLESLPLRGASASISSKNSTQGEAALALANTWRTARSLSPTNLFSSSGPWTVESLYVSTSSPEKGGWRGLNLPRLEAAWASLP